MDSMTAPGTPHLLMHLDSKRTGRQKQEGESLLVERDLSLVPPVKTFAAQLAEDLKPMDESLDECTWLYLAWIYLGCAWQAAKLLPSVGAVIITNMVMYILLSVTKQADSAAAFGMYLSYNFVFCISVQFALIEKFGQEMSRGYGKKDYIFMRKTSTQGLIAMLFFYICFNLPFLYFADKVLLFANIDPLIVPLVVKCLRLHVLVLMIQLPVDLLNAFCMAQGLESEISRAGIPGCIVSSALQYYLVIHQGYGPEAFLWGLMAFGLCSLVNVCFTLCKCDPNTVGFLSLKDSLDGLDTFIYDTFNFLLASIGEFLGSNITHYFIAIRHDTTAMGAFSAKRSYGAIMYRVGVSLSSICRTRVNILIGMGKHKTAKNFFNFFWVSNIILGTVVACLGLIFRSQISWLFANQNEDIKASFVRMIVVYCLACCIPEIALSTSLVGIRAVGKVLYQILANFLLALSWHIPCCYLMNRHELEPQWLIVSFAVNLAVLSLFAFQVAQLSDWSLIKVNK